MDVLLSLKVFSLYFYLFLDFFFNRNLQYQWGSESSRGTENRDPRRGWGWGRGAKS